MSIESPQPRSLPARPGYVARVRLPDDTEQDVALGYGRAGELVARLVDGAGSRAPEVRLDFTQGATPRVTWAEPDAVPLATSLQIVGKVCEALALAAGGSAPSPVSEPRPATSPAAMAVVSLEAGPASRRWPRALAAAGFAATGVIALVALGAVRPPAEPPRPAIPAAPVEAPPPPVAEALPAAPIAPPVVAPAPVAPAKHLASRGHRGFRLLRQQVEHGVRGLSPGTGLVALRTSPGLEVAVDGLWVGMTPVRPMVLGEGSHVLELRRTGKRAETLELGVAAGDKATLFLRFE